MDFKKIKKIVLFSANILLFVFLIIFSARYWHIIVDNFKSANKIFILYAFICLLAITVVVTIRWYFLLKPFNRNKKIKFSRLYYILNGSTLYKYVPPKGVNYMMRVNFAQKKLKGVITSTFGEFYSETYFYSLCLLIFILNYVFINDLVLYLTIFLILLGTFFFAFPGSVINVLNLFKIKFVRLRELIIEFTKLTRSREYYYSLFFLLIAMSLYGLTLYFLLSAFNLSKLSVFVLTVLFFSAHLISMLFMAPGGLGVRDAGLAKLLTFLGITTAGALVIALMLRALIFFMELIVGIFCIFQLKKEDGFLKLKEIRKIREELKTKGEDVEGFFDTTASEFSSMYHKSGAFKERKHLWQRYINKHLPKNPHSPKSHHIPQRLCLDVGCGDGIFSVYLAYKGQQVIGIDQSKEMIKLATKNAQYRNVNCNFICASFPLQEEVSKEIGSGKVSLITCSSMLEYVDQPEQTIKNFYDLLESDGTLLISLPNKQSVYRLGERFVKKLGLFKDSYIYYQKNQYTFKEAQQLFSKNGFHLLENEYFAFHSLLYNYLPKLKNKYLNTQMMLVFRKR